MKRVNYKELTSKVLDIVSEKKGDNIIVYDVRKLTSFTDFLMITTLKSEVQMRSILKDLRGNIKEITNHIEGEASSGWILIDYGGLIVNLFLPEVREFYGLERLWGEAKTFKI